MHTRQGAARPAQPKHNLAAETFSEMVNRVIGKYNLAPKIDASQPEHAPHWAPLEKLCPPGLCEQFMFMGSIDGIYLYKHVDSRRYLNVDVLGETYSFNSQTCRYERISIGAAMQSLAHGLFVVASRQVR